MIDIEIIIIAQRLEGPRWLNWKMLTSEKALIQKIRPERAVYSTCIKSDTQTSSGCWWNMSVHVNTASDIYQEGAVTTEPSPVFVLLPSGCFCRTEQAAEPELSEGFTPCSEGMLYLYSVLYGRSHSRLQI